MSVNGIEDILISRDYNKKKKKSKSFIVIFFLLFIILAGLVGAYWYLTKEEISSKELFVQNVSKININKFLNNEIYENVFNRIQKESSQINSSINFTTDLENEELQDIDITKFKLDILNSNDVINKKSFGEAVLNYSGNEIFKLNLIANENQIAISSNEILDKYIGVNFEKIKDVFGVNVDINELKELNKIENTNFTENELNEYVKKYFEIILNNLSEEQFTVQENIAIENATEDVEVTNYSLNLSQDELNAVLIRVLEEIKNDDKLINKLILVSEEKIEENKTTPTITPSNDENNQEIIQQDDLQLEGEGTENKTPEENIEPEIPVIQINPVGTISVTTEENSNNTNDELTENSQNTSELIVEEPISNGENTNINQENNIIETTNIDELIKQEYEVEEQLIKILLGKKVNLNKEQFIELIEKVIKKVNGLSGEGIKLNVYASQENVEKINLILPNSARLEIDFYPDENPELNSNQSYIKMTYLTENDASEKNGFSLEINKEQTNASTKINSIYSFIENEKINKKIKINLETEGIVNSKEIKNDIVITFATNKSEIQVAIDNTIQFKEVSDLPGINTENCIFLDLLPENERQELLNTIKNQITTLYNSKKENLNFIDTNTYSQTTLDNQNTVTNQTPPTTSTSTVTREEAEKALIDKVVSMMDEAIAKNEEFTIQNLADLKIDGYKVSSAVTSDAALIVVDVYKFKIDTGFTLTYVE